MSRDLQEDIDIGLSRSTEGMRTSDPSILIDHQTSITKWGRMNSAMPAAYSARNWLGSSNGNPHVVAVVTSRPTADSKPATYDQFRPRYFQPLSDGEQTEFSERFWRTCHGCGFSLD